MWLVHMWLANRAYYPKTLHCTAEKVGSTWIHFLSWTHESNWSDCAVIRKEQWGDVQNIQPLILASHEPVKRTTHNQWQVTSSDHVISVLEVIICQLNVHVFIGTIRFKCRRPSMEIGALRDRLTEIKLIRQSTLLHRGELSVYLKMWSRVFTANPLTICVLKSSQRTGGHVCSSEIRDEI